MVFKDAELINGIKIFSYSEITYQIKEKFNIPIDV